MDLIREGLGGVAAYGLFIGACMLLAPFTNRSRR